MARLGFAPVLGGGEAAFGPPGWVILGIEAAISLAFLRFGSPRGNYQKFDREVYPTLKSAAEQSEMPALQGWFNELVGVDPDGTRKVYGSWEGMGPEWGDLAVKKLHELAREKFLWSYQPGADTPWKLLGPSPEGPGFESIVWKHFPDLLQAMSWWFAEKNRVYGEIMQQIPPEEIIPTEPDSAPAPVDPGDISNPAPAPIDPPITTPPPSPSPPAQLPRQIPWWQRIIQSLPGLGGRLPGRYPPGQYPPGTYPPGGPWGGPGAGTMFGADDEWMYLGAAALLLFAASRKKKKKGNHAHEKK